MIRPVRKTLTQSDVLRILRTELPFLSKEFGVVKLSIFGSFAKGKQTPKSDVDIFVQLKKPLGFEFIDLIDYLEQKIGRNVDLLTPGAIKGMRVKSIAREIQRSLMHVKEK